MYLLLHGITHSGLHSTVYVEVCKRAGRLPLFVGSAKYTSFILCGEVIKTVQNTGVGGGRGQRGSETPRKLLRN